MKKLVRDVKRTPVKMDKNGGLPRLPELEFLIALYPITTMLACVDERLLMSLFW